LFHFDRAARQYGIGLVDHHEIRQDMPEETQNARRPLSLRATTYYKGEIQTIPVDPDRLFALIYPDVRHNFALEQDEGTMDIWANRLVNKPSIRRKQMAYYLALMQRRIARRWDFKKLSRSFRHHV
jgi:hypothetical protein